MTKYSYSLIYALSTSLSIILIEKMGEQLPPLLSLLICTLFTTVYFHLINFKTIPLIYRQMFKATKDWLLNCAIVAVIWIVTFYGAKEADGFMFLFVYFITAAIISCVALLLHNAKISYSQLIGAIGLLALLIIVVFIQQPPLKHLNYAYGILLAIIGGISAYIYRKMSYSLLNKSQLSASQILSVRFYGIILIAMIATPHNSFALLNFKSFIYTIIIAILSFLLPLYANQRGIINAGPEVHSIIGASCPLITYVLESSINHTWSISLLICSIIGSGLLVLSVPRSRDSLALTPTSR
jgi:hypothetical protein